MGKLTKSYCEKELNLKPHNAKTYLNMVKSFEEFQIRRLAVVQATGTGKGYLAAALVSKNGYFGKYTEDNSNNHSKVIIVVPNKAIKTNYKQSLGLPENNSHLIITTYQAIQRAYSEAMSGQSEGNKEAQTPLFTLIKNTKVLIFDEFHRVGALEWGKAAKYIADIVEAQGGYVIGLSATPVRFNDKNVAIVDEYQELSPQELAELAVQRDMVKELFRGNELAGVNLAEAVARGILPSFKYVIGSYGVEKVYEKLQEMTDAYLDDSINRVSRKGRNLQMTLEKLNYNFGDEDKNLRKLIQEEQNHLGANQKWIVFCRDKEELLDIDDKLNCWFERPDRKITILQTYSEMPMAEQQDNLSKFYTENKGIVILKCVNQLNEGAHVPAVTGVLMLRRTASPILYMQQMGRALSAANTMTQPIIFDLVGNMDSIERITAGTESKLNNIIRMAEEVKAIWREHPELHTGTTIPEIKIKNAVLNEGQLFNHIKTIFRETDPSNWSELQLKILTKYWPMGGAQAVQDEMHHNCINREKSTIISKAKELGIYTSYSLKTNKMSVNIDNSLSWSKREDDIILRAFSQIQNMNNAHEVNSVCMDLSSHHMHSRTADQIKNRYSHLMSGRQIDYTNLENLNSRWTEEDIKTLKVLVTALNPNTNTAYTNSEIAQVLGRSTNAVLTKRRALELDTVKRNVTVTTWTPEEEDRLYKELWEVEVNYRSAYDSELKKAANPNQDGFQNRTLAEFHKATNDNYDKRKAAIEAYRDTYYPNGERSLSSLANKLMRVVLKKRSEGMYRSVQRDYVSHSKTAQWSDYEDGMIREYYEDRKPFKKLVELLAYDTAKTASEIKKHSIECLCKFTSAPVPVRSVEAWQRGDYY